MRSSRHFLSGFFDSLVKEADAPMPRETLTIETITSRLGSKGYGAFLLVFSLIASLPFPGPNAILSVPLLILSYQLMVGKTHVSMPRKVREKELSYNILIKYYTRLRPRIIWLENKMQPRWYRLIPIRKVRLIGFISMFLAVTIALPFPLPGANTIPALGLGLIGLGIMMRDGLAIFIGGLIGMSFSIALYALAYYTFVFVTT